MRLLVFLGMIRLAFEDLLPVICFRDCGHCIDLYHLQQYHFIAVSDGWRPLSKLPATIVLSLLIKKSLSGEPKMHKKTILSEIGLERR